MLRAVLLSSLIWSCASSIQASVAGTATTRPALFTTSTGRTWRERNFYRDLWLPAQESSRLDIRPHECRHSHVTHLRAAGVDDADLAEMAGRRVETMLARYTHAVGRSHATVRATIG